MQDLFGIIKMSLKTYSVYIKSKCERYIVFMPSWDVKEVCQIIIHDAYGSLCTKENILGLQTAEPPGQSVEPPHSAHLESSNQNRKHHIYMNKHHTVMEC